jgi:hypothetical protein
MRSYVVAALVTLGLVVACSVEVDVANKACPCGSGYVCDQARNVCVLPEDLKVETAPPPPPPACGDACPCTVDPDCKDAARPRCSPAKTCVECTKTPDTCPAGSYCNDLFQCTLGCKEESDCQISPTVPHCETTRRQCVECITADHCTGGNACSPSGVCTKSCSPTQPCTSGTCCGGFCVDTQTDVLNCGGCAGACVSKNGTPKCTAGACSWTCASGFAHCENGNTGCETNTRTDVAHCGSCTKRCDNLNAKNVTCTAGACAYTTCNDGFGDCDGNRTNGCECACGAVKNQPCCPGNVCVGGLTCNTASNKCQ